VRATGYYNDTWAIGFNADGTAFIARNGLSVSVSFGGQAVKLGGGINKVRKLTDSAAVGGLTLQKQYKYGKVLLWKYTKPMQQEGEAR
jgi:hypothetical protein